MSAERIFTFGSLPAYYLADTLVEHSWDVRVGATTISSTRESHSAAVAKLFTLGLPPNLRQGLDYLPMDLGAEDAPDLIRLALSWRPPPGWDTLSAAWVPVHAWRTLSQLQAETAIVPLLGLLSRIDTHQDFRVLDEIGYVLGGIGPAVIPAATEYLSDPSHGAYPRAAAAAALQRVGELHPESRAFCADLKIIRVF